jgi:putative acetyltransferase
MTTRIRQSVPCDFNAIGQVHIQAFGDEEGPEIVKLVSELMNDRSAFPLLSLVADMDRKIAAHILFTRVVIEPAAQGVSAQILAPLAVLPEFQNRGIGGQLIRQGLLELKQSGTDLVFVLGHPGYYPRSGFTPATPHGLVAPYPIAAKNADAWMVQALREGVIGTVTGQIRSSDALNQPQYWVE